MNGKWNSEFMKVNLIKEIKLRRWLKASFYDNFSLADIFKRTTNNFEIATEKLHFWKKDSWTKKVNFKRTDFVETTLSRSTIGGFLMVVSKSPIIVACKEITCFIGSILQIKKKVLLIFRNLFFG